jgi:PmbA protein
MEGKKMVDAAIAAMRQAGADQGQAWLGRTEKTELNVDAGAMSLLRTTADLDLSLVAYVGGRKGSGTVNNIDPETVEAAVLETVEAARSAQPDAANDIAPLSSPQSFSSGDAAPDLGAMHERLDEFLRACAARHPKVQLEQCILDFSFSRSWFANSNGVALEVTGGIYAFNAMFTAKDGRKTSSFNYSGASRRSLDQPLLSWGGLDGLMLQSAGQLDTRVLDGKFEGHVLITPHCLGDFMGALEGLYLGDYGLISGTSPYRDALGTDIASPLLTLRSAPSEVQDGHFITREGFVARDSVIIDKGRLAGFSLGLYGSNKSGKPRCPSGGGCLVVEPGAQAMDDLVKGIDRGILLCRFSGGQPSDNGDFSGVAKNSYLIEEGRIVRPLAETMVSGNLVRLLKDIDGVSRERIDFGNCLFPWLRANGVTVSGK